MKRTLIVRTKKVGEKRYENALLNTIGDYMVVVQNNGNKSTPIFLGDIINWEYVEEAL
jgi:hypothetical protein